MQHEDIGQNDATLHYLDVIYRLTIDGDAARTTEIANRLRVTASGASVMLRRLAERKLVQLTPYKGATLTAEGKRIALRTIRRHRMFELFLVKFMGFAWHEVDEHAHALETVITDGLEARMDEMLNHPTRCPHGHLIPGRDGRLPDVRDVMLVAQPVGCSGVIQCIDTDNSEWLRYIGELGLTPGTHVTLKEIAPYGGPVTLSAAGRTHTLGKNLAELVFIEIDHAA